jgi:hypothetical protein
MIHKTTIILLLIMLFPFIIFANNGDEVMTISSFDNLRWKNRILLIYEKESADNFRSTLQKAEEQLRNRDVLWFLLREGKITSNSQLSWDDGFFKKIEKMYFPNRKNKVLLIGKDGGTKSINKKLVLDNLISLIDSMPMRRLETLEHPTKN